MRNITFGQYYPTDSPIHHLNPKAKILFTLLYLIGIFFVTSYTSYLIVFTFIVFIIVLARLPFAAILKSIRPVLFLVILTAIMNLLFTPKGKILFNYKIINISVGGIHMAIKLTLRLIALVIGTSVLTFTTTPTEITDGLEALMKPLNYIKFPVHDIAIIMSIALRFIPGFIDEIDKIIMAQKARGADFDSGNIFKRAKALVPVLIPLFVNAFRKADDLADALDARCYNATPNRTKMRKHKFSYRDLVALIIFLSLFVFIFLDRYYLLNVDRFIWTGLL